jgi:hypothetical protein
LGGIPDDADFGWTGDRPGIIVRAHGGIQKPTYHPRRSALLSW